jgi:hypothetical protein
MHLHGLGIVDHTQLDSTSLNIGSTSLDKQHISNTLATQLGSTSLDKSNAMTPCHVISPNQTPQTGRAMSPQEVREKDH